MQGTYKVPMPDGTEIFVKIQGQGYPLVFLHGNSMDSHYFDGQVSHFAHHYQVILVDSRGHGQSHHVRGDISFRDMASDLAKVFDYLAISEALLIGHSDGANLALVFQHYYPNRVSGLVLNAGNWRFKGLKFWFRGFVKIQYFFWKTLSIIIPNSEKKLAIIKLMLEDLPITKEDLGALQIPCLILVGSRDIVRESHSLALATILPMGEFRSLHGLRHNLAYKHSQIFNLILGKFIRKVIKEREN